MGGNAGLGRGQTSAKAQRGVRAWHSEGSSGKTEAGVQRLGRTVGSRALFKGLYAVCSEP